MHQRGTPERCLAPSTMFRQGEPGKGPSLTHTWALILVFPASKTVSDKFLLLINYSLCDILL